MVIACTSFLKVLHAAVFSFGDTGILRPRQKHAFLHIGQRTTPRGYVARRTTCLQSKHTQLALLLDPRLASSRGVPGLPSQSTAPEDRQWRPTQQRSQHLFAPASSLEVRRTAWQPAIFGGATAEAPLAARLGRSNWLQSSERIWSANRTRCPRTNFRHRTTSRTQSGPWPDPRLHARQWR